MVLALWTQTEEGDAMIILLCLCTFVIWPAFCLYQNESWFRACKKVNQQWLEECKRTNADWAAYCRGMIGAVAKADKAKASA